MTKSLEMVAEAISIQSDAAIAKREIIGGSAVFLIGAVAGKQKEWSNLLDQDALQIYVDLMTPDDPSSSGRAAADTQKKTADTTQADLEIGKEQTLIEEVKSGAQAAISSQNLVISLEEPVKEILASATLILGRTI